MKLFGKKEEIKKQILNQKPKVKKQISKGKITKAIVIGIAALAAIILIAFLTKNTLIIILVAIVAQIGFIVYLANFLEVEHKTKIKQIKEKEIAEQKAKNLQQQLEKTKIQAKAKQKKLVPQLTNIEEMKKYIEKALRLRFKKEEIKATLVSRGWPPQKIEKAFLELQQTKAKRTI